MEMWAKSNSMGPLDNGICGECLRIDPTDNSATAMSLCWLHLPSQTPLIVITMPTSQHRRSSCTTAVRANVEAAARLDTLLCGQPLDLRLLACTVCRRVISACSDLLNRGASDEQDVRG